MGYCESLERTIQAHITSTDSDLRRRVPRDMAKKELLETLRRSYTNIHETTVYPETLGVTDSRQYASMGLTYITDELFEFFIALEKCRVQLLNSQTIRKEKEKVIEVCKDRVSNDGNLKSLWHQSFTEALRQSDDGTIKIGSCHTITENLAKKLINELFVETTDRYINMGAAQFLKDFRQEKKIKKTEAHRKKALQKSKKQDILRLKVQIKDIETNTSPN